MKRRTSLILVLAVPLTLLFGCAAMMEPVDLAPYKSQIVALEAVVNQLESAAVIDEDKVDAAKAALASSKAKVDELSQRNDVSGIEAILGVASSAVAPLGPWGGIGAVVLGSAATWFRQKRKTKTAQSERDEVTADLDSLGRALAVVADANEGTIDTNNAKTKMTLDSIMTAGASRVVRGHLGKNV